MKAILPACAAFVLSALVTGCDITASAPPPGDASPASAPAARSAPGSSTGPRAAAAAPKATPKPGDWLFKDYQNPLDAHQKKKK